VGDPAHPVVDVVYVLTGYEGMLIQTDVNPQVDIALVRTVQEDASPV